MGVERIMVFTIQVSGEVAVYFVENDVCEHRDDLQEILYDNRIPVHDAASTDVWQWGVEVDGQLINDHLTVVGLIFLSDGAGDEPYIRSKCLIQRQLYNADNFKNLKTFIWDVLPAVEIQN